VGPPVIPIGQAQPCTQEVPRHLAPASREATYLKLVLLLISYDFPSSFLFITTHLQTLLQFTINAELRETVYQVDIREHLDTVIMVDPVEFVEAVFKTSKLLVPTASVSATPTVSPIPTVIPNVPHYERVGETGTKTLWVGSLFCCVCISNN
jgi:hypothetical protein